MAVDVESRLDTPALPSGPGRRPVRLVLRALPVLVFVAAIFVLVSLVMDSGVVGGKRNGRVLFTDVPETHAHRSQIEQVARLNILPGVTNTVFAPGDPVSRALMAEALVRTMNWPVAAGEKQPYQDVEGVSSRIDASDYIAVASSQGVLGRASANGPPLFKPDQATTLGQALAAFVRAGGKSLTVPTKPDPVVAKLKVSNAVKTTLSTAQANGLLADSGIDLAKADLSKPITREQLAVLISNFRKVVTPTPSG